MKKITVITINYNNLQGLRRTVPSVLSQTFDDFEYVVVDGESTDGSREYIEAQPGIDAWVSEKDGGIYNAMNKAVAMAHGEYCIFMNSGDNFFSALSLESAAKELDGSDYCTGQTVVAEDDHVALCLPPKVMSFNFVKEHSLQHQSTFIKTELLRARPYDESFRIVSDWAHFLECWYLDHCTYKSLQTIVATFYFDGISSQNVSLAEDERRQELVRLFGDLKKIPNPAETKEQKKERLAYILRYKVKIAMRKQPLARDWKLLRNGLKFFFKDLFV